MKITIQDIFEAYKKFKNYCYYDNTSLYYRKKIAEFEEPLLSGNGGMDEFKQLFSNKVSDLLEIVNNGDNVKLQALLDQIGCLLIPKSGDDNGSNTDEKDMTFITNKTKKDTVLVSKVNAMIDAPIEIHLLSVLWLMKVGIKYNNEVTSNSYANIFELKDDNAEDSRLIKGYHLYKPYFKGYQDWRDKAMSDASRLLKEGHDATIVSLDIQRFFYTVRIDIEHLLSSFDVKIEDDNLTHILSLVHKEYRDKIKKYIPESKTEIGIKNGGIPLPVGLLSSGFIANLFMSKFDKAVISRLSPSYYGRYVDDMLFVLSDFDVENPQNFINEVFVNNSRILKKEEGDGNNLIIDVDEGYNTLRVQSEKVVVEQFDHTESPAALKKFISNLSKQRSEFRFLPNEEDVDEEFDESAFNLQYSDSINKFRSIKDFKTDKYGASAYLAHKIFLSCYSTRTNCYHDKASAKQIINFFTGKTAIFFYSLWEKVAIYFVLNDDISGLNKFEDNVKATTKSLVFDAGKNKLSKDLNDYLDIAIASAYAPRMNLISAEKNKKRYDLSKSIRRSNLFRHQLLPIKAVTISEILNDDSDLISCYVTKEELEEDERIISLYPHFIHFEEFCIIDMYEHLDDTERDAGDIIGRAKERYKRNNYNWLWLFNPSKANAIDHFTDFVGYKKEKHLYIDSGRRYVEVCDLPAKESIDNRKQFRVAIANMKVNESVAFQTKIGKPDLSYQRRKDLFLVVNEAIKYECSLLVLPELAVPSQWIGLLASQCKISQMAIVSGITYLVDNGYAYNKVVTFLPVMVNGYPECVVIPRTKNHYAPGEIETLRGYGYKVPHIKPSIYHLFHWHNLYFSVYNCFELASIEDRSLFKSRVDLIVATELNKDTKYYSDIIGSWARDIHCYLLQVNSSAYGDSRIMQPSKSETRDIVIVKGGKNATILYDELDIDKLRKFQLKESNLQLQDKTFKVAPPDYDRDFALKRIQNQPMY